MRAVGVCAVALLLGHVAGKIIDFEQAGAIADSKTAATAHHNTGLLCTILNSTMVAGDTLVVVKTEVFFVAGNINVDGLHDVTIQIDGTLLFDNDRHTWPTHGGVVYDAITVSNLVNVLFTSSGKGVLDGQGAAWWGALKFLVNAENRPKLFHMPNSRNITIENLLFKNSPFWTFWADGSDGLVVRYCEVDVRWDNAQTHDLLDIQALNTDGFDITGKNVYMHDLNIWNDDDCISVKDGSENMLFERINASGLGLVIGSIGESVVNNITFRNATMYNTFKGIYLKTRYYNNPPAGPSASISNILFENILIDNPEQFAIWIGPAQQTGQPCPIGWPELPFSKCEMCATQTWSNITLRNITVTQSNGKPTRSPGVLIGNMSNPITW